MKITGSVPEEIIYIKEKMPTDDEIREAIKILKKAPKIWERPKKKKN